MNKGSLIARGATAEIFAWGSDSVLKLFGDTVPLEWIEREYAVTRMVQETGLPVPRVDALVEQEGRPGIIYDRVDGMAVSEVVSRNPTAVAGIARMMAELHARIHAVELPDLPPLKELIETLIRMATATPDALKEAAVNALRRLPDGDSLCHFDFHADNVLLTESGPVVIDWMGASNGDPIADVARTRQLCGLDDKVPRKQSRADAMLRLGYQVYLRRYREVRQAPPEAISTWRLPIVAARIFEYAPGKESAALALLGRLASHS